MYKTGLIFMVVGICVLVLCSGIVFFNFYSFKDMLKGASTVKGEIVEKKSDIENVTKFKIDTRDDNILFEESTSGNVEISYYETEYIKYNFVKDGDTLVLKRQTKLQIFSFDFNFFENRRTVVRIPKDYFKYIEINDSNSEVNLSNMKLDSLIINTSNGKIILDNIKCTDRLDLNTTNARIELKEIEATNYLKANSTNGTIEMYNVKSDKIDGKTTNARVEVENITTNSLIISSTNGSINARLYGKVEEYNSKYKTSNGHITINGDKFADTRIEKTYENSKRILDLKTSNANVKVEFEK